jgi:Sec-independent protein secretion pathway component TatC
MSDSTLLILMGSLFVAMLLTPPDVASQLLLGLLLFFAVMGIGRLLGRQRKRGAE